MRIIVLIVLFSTGCAHFDRTEKVMLGTAWALAAMDCYQTTRISDYPGLEESNPMIRDDKGAFIIIGGSAGLVTLCAAILPPKLRKAVLGFYIGTRADVVRSNHRLGIR